MTKLIKDGLFKDWPVKAVVVTIIGVVLVVSIMVTSTWIVLRDILN